MGANSKSWSSSNSIFRIQNECPCAPSRRNDGVFLKPVSDCPIWRKLIASVLSPALDGPNSQAYSLVLYLKLKVRRLTSWASGIRGFAVQMISRSLVSWCQIAEKRDGSRRLFRVLAKEVGSSGIMIASDESPHGFSIMACLGPSFSKA